MVRAGRQNLPDSCRQSSLVSAAKTGNDKRSMGERGGNRLVIPTDPV